MSLLVLQQGFSGWLRSGRDETTAGLSPSQGPGLRVYRNNYRAQLVGCLEISFPHTRAWIGEDAFDRAAMQHIGTIPPSSWTLDAYGRDFPLTLAATHPDDPEVFELAWLEWALSEAFVGKDCAVLTADLLADVDWDRVTFNFSPTLDIADAKTNASMIWSALSQDSAPPMASLLAQPGAILVWRHENVSRFRLIETAERDAILLMRPGASFAQLCEQSANALGQTEGVAFAGRLLGRWIGDGLLAGLGNRA